MKDLNYFKNALKAILDKQEKEEQVINKALTLIETIQKAGRRVYAVNDKVEWKGKKYVKCADKKWRRYYDKEERGTAIASAYIKKEIDSATSGEELMRIALKHRARFSDEYGSPLPILDELRAYIDNRSEDIDKGKTTPRTRADAKRANTHVKYRGIQKYMKEQEEREREIEGAKKISEAIASDKTRGDKAFLRENLKQVLEAYKGQDIVNKKYGTVVQIANKGIKKINSDDAIAKSLANGFTMEEHFMLARKLPKLFEWADFASSKADERSTEADNVDIERYVSCEVKLPSGKKAQVKITVKWTKSIGKRRIYSLEAVDFINKETPTKSGGNYQPAIVKRPESVGDNNSISQIKTPSREEAIDKEFYCQIVDESRHYSEIRFSDYIPKEEEYIKEQKEKLHTDNTLNDDEKEKMLKGIAKSNAYLLALKNIKALQEDLLTKAKNGQLTLPTPKVEQETLDKIDKMDRGELFSFIRENAAKHIDIDDVGRIEDASLRDFCKAWAMVKSIAKPLPRLEYFGTARMDRGMFACFSKDRFDDDKYNCIFLNRATSQRAINNQGKKNDADRLAGKREWSVLRNSGKGGCDVFLHELGHFLDNRAQLFFGDIVEETFEKAKADNTLPSTYGGDYEDPFGKTCPVEEFFAECFAKYMQFGSNSLTAEQRQLVAIHIEYLNKIDEMKKQV